MERRSFLKVGVFGGLLLAIGGGLAIGLRPGDRSVRPTRALNVISEAAFPVLVAVAARVTRGTSASPIEIAQRVDEAVHLGADARVLRVVPHCGGRGQIVALVVPVVTAGTHLAGHLLTLRG